jgi:hypothetical protein
MLRSVSAQRRWAVALGVVVVVGGWVVWRGLDDDGERVSAGRAVLLDGRIPVREGLVGRAGARIRDGFVVEDGSALIGVPLPDLYSVAHGGMPLASEGWRAFLVVTEPGRRVLERYVEQAQALGFAMSDVSCYEDERLLFCQSGVTEGFSREDGYDHYRSLWISLQQGPAHEARSRPPMSAIAIVYGEVGDPPYPEPEAHPVPPNATEAAGEVPDDWPPLSPIGEEFWSFRTTRDRSRYKVVPGTTQLAPSMTNSGHDAQTLFEVTVDPRAVFDAFLSQAPSPRLAQRASPRKWERDGITVQLLAWTDGTGQSLTVVEQPGLPTMLLHSSTPSD